MKKLKMRRSADREKLCEVDGFVLPQLHYRRLVDCIHPGCYVEAHTTKQGGTVKKVIRNKDGFAVCVRVEDVVHRKDGQEYLDVDYISVDRINFIEPYTDVEWASLSEYDDPFEPMVDLTPKEMVECGIIDEDDERRDVWVTPMGSEGSNG